MAIILYGYYAGVHCISDILCMHEYESILHIFFSNYFYLTDTSVCLYQETNSSLQERINEYEADLLRVRQQVDQLELKNASLNEVGVLRNLKTVNFILCVISKLLSWL